MGYILIYQYLKERSLAKVRDFNRKEMIAFGGANYKKTDILSQSNNIYTQNWDNIRSEGYHAIDNNLSLLELYKKIGSQNLEDIPESYNEVIAIKNNCSKCIIVTGDDVKESLIKELSASEELENFDLIHFATHGLIVPEFPELSALVLSSNNDNKDDNFLRAGEILDLKLNADFVNLSACNTALAKSYFAEGSANGLSHAFVAAGANSMSLSLWEVDDLSTRVFMESLYSKYNKGYGWFSRYFNEVKREFIEGVYGELYRAPYYWAPFVFYGEKDPYGSIIQKIINETFIDFPIEISEGFFGTSIYYTDQNLFYSYRIDTEYFAESGDSFYDKSSANYLSDKGKAQAKNRLIEEFCNDKTDFSIFKSLNIPLHQIFYDTKDSLLFQISAKSSDCR